MIIFDLDGTLADCEHRRHFVDPSKNPDYKWVFDRLTPVCESEQTRENIATINGSYYHKKTNEKFKPDWKSFYEACDQDKPIEFVRYMAECLYYDENELSIWSGRCESVRKKTEEWLIQHCGFRWFDELKMRPIGNSTPDDELKEKWLDERIKHCEQTRPFGLTYKNEHDIVMVFDDRPKVVRMWKRRGIFVFNCQQDEGEF